MGFLTHIALFACLALSRNVFAIPVQPTHQSGGAEHIVIIDQDHPVSPQVEEVLSRLALDPAHPDVVHVYNNSAFRGFSASMKSHCLQLLANMTDVSMVEKAATVSRTDTIRRDVSLAYDTRPNAPWGLQRISSASNPGGSVKALDFTYSFANTDLGKGADIYILDTGINTKHNIFNGRANMLWTFDNDPADLDGHGTHVSGTAAGDILGIASNANVFGVKALDAQGGGWSSNVVAGIDQVIANHDNRRRNTDFLGSVMSMSLSSGSPVQAITAAINAAIQAGVHTCVAAGNDGEDACETSPASSGGTQGPAITVGSVGMAGMRSTFSNYGRCVDVYAPGEDIISSWIGSPNMINSLTGTSMATPHVTGIVAYAMSNKTLADSPSLMKQWIRMTALSLSQGPNTILLANNGVQGGDSQEGILGYTKISSKVSFTPVIQNSTAPGAAKRYASLEMKDFFSLVESDARLQGESWASRIKRTIVPESFVSRMARLFEQGAKVRTTSWIGRMD